MQTFLKNTRLDSFSVHNNFWILLLFFFLPFNYAFTIKLGFPLKVSEICIFIIYGVGIFFIPPRYFAFKDTQISRVILFFAAFVTLSVFVNFFWRYDYPFKAYHYRLHPRLDGILKYIYFLLDIAVLFIAYHAFRVNKWGYIKIWMYGSLIAALYSWYLFCSSMLKIPYLLLPGMDNNPQTFLLSIGRIIRCGTFKEGNYMGVYLMICYIVSTYYRRPKLSWFFFLSIVTTFSSVALLASGAFFIITTFKKNYTRRRLPILLSIIFLLMLSAGIALQNEAFRLILVKKITSDSKQLNNDSFSKLDRMNSVKVSIRQTIANPILGVGLSNYGLHFDEHNRHPLFTYPDFKPIPNNVYFEVLCETGIVGFTIFMFFLYLLFRSTKRDQSGILRPGLLSILICFAAFPTFSVLFIWVFFGLIMAVKDESSN